jgi:hypothetical protein
MDWDVAAPDYKPPKAEPPAPELLEPAWRATSPTGKVLTCGLYRGVAGRVEVRASYPRNDLIRSELVIDIDPARTIADQWRATAISEGFVERARYQSGTCRCPPRRAWDVHLPGGSEPDPPGETRH